MRKVPVELIPTLLAEEETIRERNACMQTLFSVADGIIPKHAPYMDCVYKKGHDVPEGIYTAKILDIKCHTATAYRMKLELLNYENKVIYGYSRSYGSDFSDLADCFGEKPILYGKSTGYIGKVGMIYLTGSGWIQLLPRNLI